MTTTTMTYHARIERADRLTYIAMNVGFGETVLTHVHEDDPYKMDCLTDTGVLIIKNTYNGTVITAYVPNIDKVMAIYRKQGYERIPTYMMNKVRKNAKHLKIQNTIRY